VDAELSLRLLKRGGSGLHVHESFGHGVMPLTFEALKRQRFRWCFGGVQILRMHWRDLLPGAGGPDNRLSGAQRWAYLVGGLQWFGDLAGLAFTAFLGLGALSLALGDGLVVRRLSGLLLLCVVALLVLGVLRSLALLRRVRDTTLAEAVGAFSIWLGLSWVVSLGAARGLTAKEGAFLRTPKVRGELSWRDALRGNPAETLLALTTASLAGVALRTDSSAGAMLGTLLLWQSLGHASAPLNSLAAIRADLPDELRRRRRELLPSWSRLGVPARRALVWPVATTAVVGLVFVALAAPAGGPIGVPITPAPEERLADERAPDRQDEADRPEDDPTGRDTVPVGVATSVIASTGTSTPTAPAAGTTSPTAAPTSAPTSSSTTAATSAPPSSSTPAVMPTQAAATQTPGKPTDQPTGKPTGAGVPSTPGKPTTAPSGGGQGAP